MIVTPGDSPSASTTETGSENHVMVLLEVTLAHATLWATMLSTNVPSGRLVNWTADVLAPTAGSNVRSNDMPGDANVATWQRASVGLMVRSSVTPCTSGSPPPGAGGSA